MALCTHPSPAHPHPPQNLLAAILLAATLDLPEVCVWMESSLTRGNRTVKVSSAALGGAFDSPNFPPLATLETGIRCRPR